MREALKEAETALSKNEVPVGAIIVLKEKIIARARNLTEALSDPTAHAEILAIRKASEIIGDWRMDNCEIYVTLEPCPMCAFAIIRARIKKLVFGAYDPIYGACGSSTNIPLKYVTLNKIEIAGGILKEESEALLKAFFESRRNLL